MVDAFELQCGLGAAAGRFPNGTMPVRVMLENDHVQEIERHAVREHLRIERGDPFLDVHPHSLRAGFDTRTITDGEGAGNALPQGLAS